MKNKPAKQAAHGLRQQLVQLFDWSPASRAKSAAGKPYLEERNGFLALHFDALTIQSEMNIERPDELVFSYTRTMMSFLLFQPVPKRIAMIGLGGGSLVKYCHRYLPETEITVIEINPDVIALRREFAIPDDDERLHIRLGDGAEFVKESGQKFDVLLVDGFDASGLPAKLSSLDFYDDCLSVLTDNGILVVNLWGSNAHFADYLERIRQSCGGRMLVVNADDDTNKVALAVKGEAFPPSRSTIRHHAQQLSTAHPLNFHSKSNKVISALRNKSNPDTCIDA